MANAFMKSFSKKEKLYILLLIVVPIKLTGQDEFATSTAFHTITPEYFNPAFTGERQVLSTSMLYYNPYVGIENAPVMQLISVSSPMRKFSPISLGGSIVRNPMGHVQYNRILADFSYSVKVGSYFSESRLYFGFRFGFSNYNVSVSNSEAYSVSDPFIPNESDNQPTTGFGVAYKISVRDKYRYRVGLALPSIVRVDGSVYTTSSFILMANIPFARKSVVNPSFLMWSVRGSGMRYSFNTFVSITNYTFIIGNDNEVFLGGLGMLVKPEMYVGAVYRFSNSAQNVSSIAGFELSIRYDIFGSRDLGMKYNYANAGMFRTY
jgi:type IX secretion system PorP/SprF family membrane protein